MIRPNVYLAGPIEGRTNVEAHEWRELAQSLLEPRICAVSPLRCEPAIPYGAVYDARNRGDQLFGAASAIRHKNMLDVARCDAMLVYLPDKWVKDHVPIGTLLEIGWTMFTKPIVIVTDSKLVGDHPVLADGVGWILPTLEDAAQVLHGLFDVYSEETHENGILLQRRFGYEPVTDTTAARGGGLYRVGTAVISDRVTFDPATGTDSADAHDPNPGTVAAPPQPKRRRSATKRPSPLGAPTRGGSRLRRVRDGGGGA